MNYTSHAELVDEHWALLFKEVVQRYVLLSSSDTNLQIFARIHLMQVSEQHLVPKLNT